MKKLVILLIFLITISQAKAETVDLNTVIEQAKENSFVLKISQIDIDISETAIKEAKSEYYPKLGGPADKCKRVNMAVFEAG